MDERNEWKPFSWHCVNCGNIVTGYKDSQGSIKVECRRCQTAMVRRIKNKKQDIIIVTASNGAVRLCGGSV